MADMTAFVAVPVAAAPQLHPMVGVSVAAPSQPASYSSASPVAIAASAAGLFGAAAVLSRSSKSSTREQRVVALTAFENELGVQAPVGFWDPMGLSADGDEATFKRRRATELKHGRVSMYATIGYIVPEYFKFPGYLAPTSGLKFADVPNGLAALSKVPVQGWAQIVILAGTYEFPTYNSNGGLADPTAPGDLGWRAITSSNPEEKKRKLNAELANGRLAMMAIMGMLYQDGLTGSAWGDWSLYTDSPLRAFENELGVQAPVGFWDPVGFTADGDVAAFKRRRSVELKHGRISMMACMGFMTPEITGKLPGELSPSTGLKFADIPNGIGAISKVPALGWAQIIAYFGYVEIASGFEDYKSGTPGDYGFKVLTSKDPEALTAKLNAELANSRLAMTAIMAMIFQNGTVGNTGPEMWLGSRGAFENELGVQKPVGFWDPLGFTKDCSVADFKRRRAVELKHGRLCMLACMGYMTPDITGKFPGYLSPSMGIKFADVPNGLGALSKVPAIGWAQIVAYGGFIEITSLQEDYEDPECKPGNFGFKVITSDDPEVLKTKLNAEIANGRLAMFAIMGMMFQNGFTGTSGPGMWLPGNAFENELGVQAPVGFWDPAGFTKAGDEALFKRHRGIEIKHGRVSMWACMGYITPEYFKWPGYCSPSANLKFADIPNGLAALSKVPAAGFAQMFLFAGLIDTSYFRADESRDAGNFANGGVLGVPRGMDSLKNPEERSKKLNAEIANGRLAMMAIIGMFFQDGLTGSAWGDWALYTASPLRATVLTEESGSVRFATASGGGAMVAAASSAVAAPSGPFDMTTQPGALPPLGFWDPCGFSQTDALFKEYRGKELKHGRVAMMATFGMIVQHFWKLSACKDVPAGVQAATEYPGSVGLGFLFLITGFFEMNILADYEDKENPGNFSDPLQFQKNVGEYDTQWRNFEIQNGRMAMFGIIGTMSAGWYTGYDAVEQWANAKPVAVAFIKATIPFAP